MATLMICLDHIATWGTCGHAYICMLREHAPPTPHVAPVPDLQVRQEGRGQDMGRAAPPFLVCLYLSSPALPAPGAASLAQPRICSLVLTHTVFLLARPQLIFGTSWEVLCFPAGGNAWFERGLLQHRQSPCLPGVPSFSLSLSPLVSWRPLRMYMLRGGKWTGKLPPPLLPLR